MRTVLAVAATVTMLVGGNQIRAGALAPAPEIVAQYDRAFIERSGAQTFGEMLDTGIIRYFFTGGRNLLVLVNGRPYATTGGNLDTLPLSAIERIEVLRAESLGTIAGHAAVQGAFNLVLRDDLDGFELRAVTRIPYRDGGDARQGSLLWGSEIGAGGHLSIGVDVLNRKEIVGSTREHSRSEWDEGGSFAQAKNVSVGGNTVYVFDTSEFTLRAIPLGECDPALGYAGPLSNPPGIWSGDKGCGFAYGEFWWDSERYDQKNAIVNLDHPLGESSHLYMDANVTSGRAAFRYAPSVDVFSVTADDNLLDAINAAAREASPAFEATHDDYLSIGHRFIGHGNRDWRASIDEYDVSARVEGKVGAGLAYDAQVSAWKAESSIRGDTFVDAEIIREEIESGAYDLADPLSTDPGHLAAIGRSSLTEEVDIAAQRLSARIALEGTGPGFGNHDMAWTAGAEVADFEAENRLVFKTSDGQLRDVNGVLGSGGTSYAGDRSSVGAFTEVSVPVNETVDLRAGARADEYDDVGTLHAARLGARYRPTDTLTLRGSWSTGDRAPSMHHLYSSAAQDHPYVLCVPDSGPPPRGCDTANYRQVTRETSGNPELEPATAQQRSIGAEFRNGPAYLVTDWYWLETTDLPGQHDATWAMLNHQECRPGEDGSCIERDGGDITIHESFANIVDTEVSGVNIRFGNRVETRWGFLAMRGLWRYVTDSERRIAGEEQKYPLPRNAVRIVTSAGRGDLTVFWAVNYRGEIENRWGETGFNSWTGHDVTLDWRKPLGFENARITTGVYNLTDAKLSTNTANPTVTDGPRAAGWGRTFFATLNMRF